MRSIVVGFLCGLFLLVSFSAFSADTTPPEFRNIEFSNYKIDVSNGSQSITVTLYAYDKESIINGGSGYLMSPEGIPSSHDINFSFYQSNWILTDEVNVYKSIQIITFDKNVSAGNWAIRLNSLRDESSNYLDDPIEPTDLDILNIVSSIEIVNSNEVDVTPPEFVNLEFSTNELDLDSGSKSITVSLTVKDEGTGISTARIRLLPPEGVPEGHFESYDFIPSQWVKGEKGVYVSTKLITFSPERHFQGVWAAEVRGIYDLNNNEVGKDDDGISYSTEDLELLGINPYVVITNANAEDLTPPEFLGLELSTHYVDTTNESQKVDITLYVKDEAKPGYSYLILYSPIRLTDDILNFQEYEWQKGDEKNVYYATYTHTFPAGSLEGAWSLSVGALSDSIGNETSNGISTKDISLAGYDPLIRNNVTDEEVLDLSLSSVESEEVELGKVVNNLFSMQGNNLGNMDGVLNFGFAFSSNLSFASISIIGADLEPSGCNVYDGYGSCTATSEDWSQVEFSLGTRVNGLGEHIVTGSIDTHEGYNYKTSKWEVGFELDYTNNVAVRTLTTLNYPATPTDFDGDGIANDMDLDDDADGIPDAAEAELGLNHRDHYDGGLDLDGDGVSNSAEYLAGTDLNAADDSPRLSGRYASFEEDEAMPFVLSDNYQLADSGTIDGTGVLVKSFTVDNSSDLVIRATGQMRNGQMGFASKMDDAVSFVIVINGESVEYETKVALGDDWYYCSLEVESGFSDVMLTFSGEVTEDEAKVYLDSVYVPMVKPLVAGDYDGDGKAEITMRNPLNYRNYWKELSEGDFNEQEFGRLKDDIPVNGDFDGDGKADWAIRRRSDQTWYVKHSSDGETISKHFGKQDGDIPVAADYDGDGKTDFAIRRPSNSTWYILQSSDGKLIQKRFGLQRTDIPVPADYDGDGKADIAIRRPSNGTWYVLGSLNNKVEVTRFGVQTNDIPVPADYDGDGKDDIAVRRAADRNWYILQSSDHQIRKVRFGVQVEDIPVVSDYDGDGKADIAVRRPSSYMWYILMSSTNEIHAEEFGRSVALIPNLAPLYTRLSMTRNVSATTQSQDYVPIEDGHEERLQYKNSSSTSSPEFKGKETLEAVSGF